MTPPSRIPPPTSVRIGVIGIVTALVVGLLTFLVAIGIGRDTGCFDCGEDFTRGGATALYVTAFCAVVVLPASLVVFAVGCGTWVARVRRSGRRVWPTIGRWLFSSR